mgnify:FL=1|tara:strand:- start:256 stop:1236 length:981 start_codon:yes stop_codon:yes gene_type:complete
MVGKVTNDKKMSCSRLPNGMGVGLYGTPNEELRYSLNAIAGKERDQFRTNEAMEWGNTLEAICLEVAAERLGCDRIITDHPNAYLHPTIALEASVDAVVEFDKPTVIHTDPSKGIYVVGDSDSITLHGSGCGENKVTSFMPEDEPPLHRGPLQLQGQMLCTGMDWGFVTILYRGIEQRTFLYRSHPKTMTAIKDFVADFERRLHAETVEWYDVNETADLLAIYPEPVKEEPIALSDETIALLHEYASLQQTILRAEQTIDAMQMHFQKVLGNASVATGDGFTLKWPMRNTRAQPEKVVPPKPATSKRQSKVSIKLPKGEINVPSNS